MKARKRDVVPADPCIYCGSTRPRTKREHVMSQALGQFKQNWTLTCVCDECNMFFSKELELPLARDSREALLRIELGLKPPLGVAQFLNRRMKASLQDPGQFDGARMVMMPTKDGSGMIPVPVAQVGFKRPGEDWRFLTEPELTPEAIRQVYGDPLQMRIHAPSGDAERLKGRLAELGIPFGETHRLLDQPITEESRITVAFYFNVDQTIIRAAAKIAFNYAAKVLGAATVRRPEFDAARRFVRYGEAPEPIAQAQQQSILLGPGATTARVHACGIGWDAPRRQLEGVVSLFNEITYRLRLCRSESDEWSQVASRHIFDPTTRNITQAEISA